jgi:hypothetical protein
VDQAGPTGDRDAPAQRQDDNPKSRQQRESCHDKAQEGSDFQRRLRMGKDGAARQAGELAESVARFARCARVVRQVDRGDLETHKAQARGKEAHLLSHGSKTGCDAVGEDAEVADAPVEIESREAIENGVEQLRGVPFDVPVPLFSAGAHDDVESLLRFSIEARDILGGVLQIAIHYHVPARSRVIEAGGDRVMLAEVATHLDAADARVVPPELADKRPDVVGGPVIHQEDGEPRCDRAKRSNEPLAEFAQAGLAHVNWNDDRNLVGQRSVEVRRFD